MVKERKNLGLGLLPIAAIFLFNPMLGSMVDLFPDVIGYLLLFIGLRDVADLNYHMEESLAYFRRMIIVSAFQLLSFFWLFGFCTPHERPTATLLVTFAVAVFEIIFATKAFREMFEGFLYLGSRHGASSVFKNVGKLRRAAMYERNVTTKTASFTTFFIILKAVVTTLPECAALTINNYDEISLWQRFFNYDYIFLLRSFAVIILLPFGIVWLVKLWKYVGAVMRDTPFLTALTEKYRAEILPKEDLFLRRAIRLGTVILSIGIFFSLDIYIDYISIFPDFLCPLILLFGFFLLKPYIGKGRRFPLCAIAHLVSSVVTYVYAGYFYDHYTMSLALFSEKALIAYYIFCILKITDSIFFFATMISLLPSFRHIIENYTGFAPMSTGNFNREDKLRYVHETLSKRVKILWVLSALAALSSIFYILFVRTVSFAWWVEFLTCLVLVLHFTSTLRHITDEVEYKYMLS